jgi:phytanoyl-CoA hydroxylase
MNSDYTKFTLTETISTEQRNFFEEHGFVHFKDFINPDTVQLIVKASLEVEKKWIENNVKKNKWRADQVWS